MKSISEILGNSLLRPKRLKTIVNNSQKLTNVKKYYTENHVVKANVKKC